LRSLLLIAAVLVPGAAFAEASLDKASKLVSDQKWEPARKELDAAWKQTGNRRETVLRILELQGIVFGQLGHESKAKSAFIQLLALDPKRELPGKYNSKVTGAFEEAQAWATQNLPLEVTGEPAALDGKGRVLQLAVKVKNDTLKLVKKVRFNTRTEGGKWQEKPVDVQGAYASLDTDADGLEWWAEVLGDRDMVLAEVASARSPVKEGRLREKVAEAPPVVEKEKKPKEKPVDAPVAERERERKIEPERERQRDSEPLLPPTATASGGGGNDTLRALGYTSLGLGVASLLAGTVLGALSRITTGQLQGALATAMRDGNGVILSIPDVTDPPHVWATAMADRARSEAILANAFWGVGGGLAVVGLVLALVGRDTGEVSVGSGGLVVSW